MTTFRSLTTFLLIMCAMLATAKEVYTFHHFSTADGLLNNEVKSLYRDSEGYLWVGTVVGLNRYDGYCFKHYIHNAADSLSLADDDVVSIQEDALNNLWIKGREDNSYYDRNKDRFENAGKKLEELGLPTTGILQILSDETGNLWIVTDREISKYDFSKRKAYNILLKKPMIKATTVANSIAVIWKDKSIGLYDFHESKWETRPLPDGINDLNGLYSDSDHTLWVYSNQNDKLAYHKKNGEGWVVVDLSNVNSEQSSNFIRGMQDDRAGKIWITTDHKGLYVFDKRTSTVTQISNVRDLPQSIKDNSVASIWIDEDKTVYIGYQKSGLSYYNPAFQKFKNFKNDKFRNISTIIEDRNGNIWIGTDGYGLFYKNPKSQEIIKQIPIPGNIVVSLHEDIKGRIWIGTYLNGLLCYDNGEIIQYTTENSEISDNSVYSIQSDRTGQIWIGTLWGYLQRLNPETGSFDSKFNKSYDESVAMSMSYDGGSELYAGMMSGLAKINVMSGEFEILHTNARGDQPFSKKFIQTVFKDSKGDLWLGHNQGVTLWHRDSDSFTYLTQANGLVDNVIRGITEDDLGRIWIATSNGCSVVSFERNSTGECQFKTINYNVRDGLLVDNLSRHAILNLRDGSILIGSIEGYSIMEPEELKKSELSKAIIRFTELTIGGKRIQADTDYDGRKILQQTLDTQREINLSYHDRMIGVEFSAMDMLSPDKIKYGYKLEGIDNEWIIADGNKVLFTQLPSGKHTLYVRCIDAEGNWNGEASILKIIVDPPFWASWYAYILYALIVIAVILLYRRNLVKANKRKLNEQRLHMEQEQAVQMNEMKLRFFTNISHDFRSPLTLILTPLQVMISEVKDSTMQKKLISIQKNAEQLLALVNQLLDFRKLDVGAESVKLTMGNFGNFVKDVAASFRDYAIERTITLKVEDNAGQCFCQFDRDKIRKILTNLMSNAFKYTPDGGCVTISIFKDEHNIGISVKDTGIGISDADKKHIFDRFYQTKQEIDKTGSGVGLHIVNEYIRLHGGEIKVYDNNPCGTVFAFTIPFKKTDTDQNNCDIGLAEPDNTEVSGKEAQLNNDKKPTVLIVDDLKDMCEFLSDNLSDEFEVLTAYNGVEAMNLMKDNDVNLIVSDVMMPEMDGMELCKRVKTDLKYSHIPVILLTARAAEESKVEGFELGADDYITKPFNFSVLKLRINKFLEWTRKSHRNFSQKMDVAPSEITITKLDEQFIAKAIKMVENHIDNSEFTVEDLSREVGLTRGHLYKKLMSITGKGPSDFIRIIRLKRAKQYLEESQYHVSEIAYMVGFNSPKIFTKNFKSEFGILPSDYAKRKV